MGSNLGADTQSAEGLVVGWPSTTREQDSIASRSVLRLSMSVILTLGSPERNLLTRAPKQEGSKFTIKNILAMLFKVIP